MKRIAALFLVLIFIMMPVSAAKEQVQDINKFNASIMHDFDPMKYPEYVEFVNKKDIVIEDDAIIPEGSEIVAETIQALYELRWHKSGYFICKLLQYKPSQSEEYTDISEKEIYLIARRYEKLNKKEASILISEIVIFQAASIFVPGVDILYFFTKGAIQREKHPNWFKAGVFNAYDNSIFWFPQKGKNINLTTGDDIIIKSLDKEKADKLVTKIEKRKANLAKKIAKKDAKIEEKQKKAEIKEEKRAQKLLKKSEQAALRQEKKLMRQEQKIVNDHNIE